MARTYSHRFILARSVGIGDTFKWTCPSGKRGVVKQMSAINNAAGANVVYLAVAGFYVQRFNFQVQGESQSREMRLTIYAGEELILLCQQPDARVSVDGHLFDDTSAALATEGEADAGGPLTVGPPDPELAS